MAAMASLSDLVTTGSLRPMGVAATVERAPAGADDTLDVFYLTEVGERASEQALRWASRGGVLPAEGDDVLLFLDSLGDPWALAWPSGTTPDVSASLASLAAADVALDARLDAIEAGPEAVRLIGAAGQPGFEHGWTNFDSSRVAGFYRDRGRVYLSGLIKSGTVGTAAFTLPAGYLPTVDGILFDADSNFAFGLVVIHSSGAVEPSVGSNAHFSLEGINFRHA